MVSSSSLSSLLLVPSALYVLSVLDYKYNHQETGSTVLFTPQSFNISFEFYSFLVCYSFIDLYTNRPAPFCFWWITHQRAFMPRFHIFFYSFSLLFSWFFLCFTTLLRISNTFWIKRFLICRCPSVFEESTLSPSVGCNALRTYISILFSSVYPSPSSSFSLSLFPLFHLNLITQSVVHHTPLPEFYSESEFQPFLNDVFCYLFL